MMNRYPEKRNFTLLTIETEILYCILQIQMLNDYLSSKKEKILNSMMKGIMSTDSYNKVRYQSY